MRAAFATYPANERQVEIPWMLSRLQESGSTFQDDVLDVGGAGASYLTALAGLCERLTVADTRLPPGDQWGLYDHFHGSAAELPDDWSGRFDTVVCISVLDHVGLAAYGNEPDPEALEKVVAEIWRVLRPNGMLLVTAPVGEAQITEHPDGEQRVFGVEELRALFDIDDWVVIGETTFWLRLGDWYAPAEEGDVAGAGYDCWRADAVAALELWKDDV